MLTEQRKTEHRSTNHKSWFAQVMGHCQSKRKTLEERYESIREHNDDNVVTDFWTQAVQKSQSEEEKFILYKLLIKLYEERGHFRKMVGFAVKQFEMVRNSVNKEQVLTASLNLARAKLFLGEHQEAAKMANYSLSMLETDEMSATSYRHKIDALLTAGAANLGCSKYSTALGHLDAVLRMAHIYADKITEALACCCLSQLYFQLRDDEKGTFYPMKAESLLARYGEQWDAKNRCTIMLSTANAERKNGKLDSAMTRCEEAMGIAVETHDRASQAYCILCFADIHRQRTDNERAVPRYHAAIKMFRDIGDKLGVIRGEIGLAKCLVQMKQYKEAMNYYQLAVKGSHAAGNKSYEIRVYEDLIAINSMMRSDEEALDRYRRLKQTAVSSMKIKCGYCLSYVGGETTKLEALSCTHFFHTRCIEGGITVCRCCQQNVTELRPIN